MIDFDAVTQAVKAVLADTDVPVEVATAPNPRPTSYGVIELPPGSQRTGTVSRPEAHAVLLVRLRAVARSNRVDVARREAQRVAGVLAAALLDRTVPITGTGWAVGGRSMLSDGGVMVEGDVVNHVADFELTVVTA